VIKLLPIETFKKLFFENLLALNIDPIGKVRMHLALSMITIKPFFDRTEEDAMIITELLNALIQDSSVDVAEQAEHSEFEILQNRKKFSQKEMLAQDKKHEEFQKSLLVREKKELEERKKRAELDEETKYDI
jgi:hypothetical protein